MQEYTLPEIGATAVQASRLSNALDGSLDLDYRMLMQHANGWKALIFDLDLLSIEQIIERLDGPESWRENVALILGQDGEWGRLDELATNYFLVANSETSVSHVLYRRPGKSGGSRLIWASSHFIELFASFSDFMLRILSDHKMLRDQAAGERH